MAAAVVSALVSTLALLVPFPGHDLFTRIGRAEGLFKDPNVFGPFLVPAALIVLEEILTPRLLRGRRTTKAVAVLLLCLGVLFSYSRAAWLNLVVGLVVVLVVVQLPARGGKSAARALAVVLVALAALAAVVAFSGSLSFLEQRAKVHQSYDSGRFEGAVREHQMGAADPFGIGPGQFEARAHIVDAQHLCARSSPRKGCPDS